MDEEEEGGLDNKSEGVPEDEQSDPEGEPEAGSEVSAEEAGSEVSEEEALGDEAARAPPPIRCRICLGPPPGEMPFKNTKGRGKHESVCDGIWRNKKELAARRQAQKRARDAPAPDIGIVAGARALGAIAVDAVRRRVGPS